MNKYKETERQRDRNGEVKQVERIFWGICAEKVAHNSVKFKKTGIYKRYPEAVANAGIFFFSTGKRGTVEKKELSWISAFFTEVWASFKEKVKLQIDTISSLLIL